jgi:hypothetical protein
MPDAQSSIHPAHLLTDTLCIGAHPHIPQHPTTAHNRQQPLRYHVTTPSHHHTTTRDCGQQSLHHIPITLCSLLARLPVDTHPDTHPYYPRSPEIRPPCIHPREAAHLPIGRLKISLFPG